MQLLRKVLRQNHVADKNYVVLCQKPCNWWKYRSLLWHR